jgi:rhodanese-related sulfurtransferase
MDGILIDVREYPEYAAGHIEGSRLVPLGTLD